MLNINSGHLLTSTLALATLVVLLPAESSRAQAATQNSEQISSSSPKTAPSPAVQSAAASHQDGVIKELLLDVLKRALVDNPTIRAQKSQIAATDSDLQAAEWARYPALSASTQATEADTSQRVITLEQPIWTGGRITGTIDFAKALKSQAEATLRAAQQEVLAQTTSAFFEVRRLEIRYEAAKENTIEHYKLVDLISRRVKLEVSPVTDQVLANSRAQLAKTEELQVLRQLETVRLQLNQLVGSPVGSIRSSDNFRFVNYASRQEAIDAALKFSPLRSQALANIDGAIAQISIAKASSWPSVVAGYTRNTQNIAGTSSTSNVGYVGVQFAPGSGLAAFSTAKAAEFRRQSAQDSLMATEQQLMAQVASAFAETLTFQDLIAPNQAFLKGMEEVLDSYMRQYQIGRKGWLDVLNAQREKTQSQVAFFDATYNLQASRLRLMFLTGDLTAANVDSIYE